MSSNTQEKKKIDYIEEIANFIFVSKYSRYNDKLGRRETWEEAVNRLEAMHLRKYSWLNNEDKKKIKWAFDLVRAKRVVPSMRSLQFGGRAIEVANARGYNCSVRHVDSLRSFAEIFYLLLCGCGVGIGLSRFFLNRLPDLVTAYDKTGTVISYVVEDTIEGWADSIEALLNCYFKNTPYTGRKIVFDYSRIRKRGTPLKTGGGKAPGFKGLKACHQKVKVLLDYIIESQYQTRLKSINAYDILMHCADAVLSGGVRRSATSIVFDKDDEDMINAKTFFKVTKKSHFEADGTVKLGGKSYQLYNGKVTVNGRVYEVSIKDYEYEMLKKDGVIGWMHIEPQRARSNNSVLLLRNEVTLEEFKKIVNRTRQFGEPGFCFANHPYTIMNPCFEISFIPVTEDGICGVQFCVAGDTKLITKNGIINIKDAINKEIEIWNGEKWCRVKPFQTGTNDKLYRVYISDGSYLDATSNHIFLVKQNHHQNYREFNTLQLIEKLKMKGNWNLPRQNVIDSGEGEIEVNAYDYGFVLGDGTIGSKDKTRRGNAFAGLYNRDKNLKFKSATISNKTYLNSYNTEYKIAYFNLSKEKIKELKHSDGLPSWIFGWSKISILEFLGGWIDADGAQANNGCRLYGTYEKLKDAQLLLTKVGVISSLNLFAKSGEKTNLGTRKNDVYYLQIPNAKEIFSQRLNLQNGKPSPYKGKWQHITKIEELDGLHESFCLTESEKHQCLFNNIITKQCNLTSMNGRLVTSKEAFKENCEAYAIIGTLQAGYTDFPYLSNAAKQLTEEESLLGCSITGLMDMPDILLKEETQAEMAKLIKEVNQIWSKKINIKPAARTTCIKPEGTSSLVLGTASGIHAHHSRRYIRRVQCNVDDPIYKFFKKHNPKLCEPSVWSANKTDDVISFPIEVSSNSMVKSDLHALKHLEIIKNTQINWVVNGTSDNNKKPISHNVSCTVIVKDNEWDKVLEYIFVNRNYFTAVSLLPETGDKDYPQAPMESIVTEEDEKHWQEIINNFKHIDYKELKEDEDNTSLRSEGSCYGNACEIIH